MYTFIENLNIKIEMEADAEATLLIVSSIGIPILLFTVSIFCFSERKNTCGWVLVGILLLFYIGIFVTIKI